MVYWTKVKGWCYDLLYENGELSLTRVIAVAGWLLFAVVSIYMVVTKQNWSNYDTFASLSGGGGAATQLANKLINSKYNTAEGSWDSKDVGTK